MFTKALDNDQLRAMAPAIFATQPDDRCSDKYNFISTIDVIDGLRDAGWQPVDAQQVKGSTYDHRMTNKHLVILEHPGIEPIGGTKVRTLMTNAHNTQAAFNFMLGLIEFACANGLVTGDMFNQISVRHNSNSIAESIAACGQVIEQAPVVMKRVEDFRQIELTQDEQNIFARSALNFRYGAHGTADEKPVVVYGSPRNIGLAEQEVEGTDRKVQYIPFKPEQMLRTRRHEDNNNSLWSTYNKIQENLIKGGAKGMNENWNRTTMREVKAIDKNVQINKALWGMAQFLADHKKEVA